MAAGIARIVEVTFIVKSQASADEEAEPVVNSFQYLPTFVSSLLLCCAPYVANDFNSYSMLPAFCSWVPATSSCSS